MSRAKKKRKHRMEIRRVRRLARIYKQILDRQPGLVRLNFPLGEIKQVCYWSKLN